MKIHISAKFTGYNFKFHDTFNVLESESKILNNKLYVANLAVQKFKEKCRDFFKIDFDSMVFFEVYFFDEEAKEVEIFKKEKGSN